MHDDESGRCQMHQVGVPELPIIQWAAQNYGDKSKIFVDCGAHMGAYSIILSDHFREVYAFEAQRRTYNQLCGNIFINEKSNITAHNKAVTDPVKANQLVDLSIVSEDGGGSTIRIPQPDQKVLATEKVKTVTLDHYHLTDVGLLKLDVEGNELNVLKGAQYMLMRSNFPPIIFEANNDEWYEKEKAQLFEFLTTMRYQIAEIRPFDNMYIAVFNEPKSYAAQ
jgi:FkbM family methyltransferase